MIFSAILGLKNIFTIENILIYNIVLSDQVAFLWYLFWALLGLIIGIGFVLHKYIFWKLAVIEQTFFLVNFIYNLFGASEENISIAFKGTISLSQYNLVAITSIVFSVVLLLLIVSQQKAFLLTSE